MIKVEASASTFFIARYYNGLRMPFIRSFFKAIAIALVCAWVMFFAGIFLSLVAMVIVSAVSSIRPDMTISYRVIGLTAGCTAFVLGFFGSIVYDVRRLSGTTSS